MRENEAPGVLGVQMKSNALFTTKRLKPGGPRPGVPLCGEEAMLNALVETGDVFVCRKVHHATPKAVVGKQQKHPFQHLVDVSQFLQGHVETPRATGVCEERHNSVKR